MARRRAAAEDPNQSDPESDGDLYRVCGCAGGAPGRAAGECPECRATGLVRIPEDEPELCELSGAVIEVYGFVQRHGLDAWIAMHGVPDERTLDLMEHFTNELERCRHAAAVKQAKELRRCHRKR